MDQGRVNARSRLCVTRSAMAPSASCSVKQRQVDSSRHSENESVGDAVRMYKGRGADGVRVEWVQVSEMKIEG